MNEFGWIETYLAPLSGSGSFGLKDDAALLDLSDSSLIVTHDSLLEGVHFLADCPPYQTSQKSLGVNLSDCVAKGGSPICYFLGLGVPSRWTESDMKDFCLGLRTAQESCGAFLGGGDTFRSPDRLVVSITLLGRVCGARYVGRSGASVGDVLFVNGTIGDAALGLLVDRGDLSPADIDTSDLVEAYRAPVVHAGFAEIVSNYATSSIDVSDGLVGDIRKLCEASDVAATIERSAIPLLDSSRSLLATDSSLWDVVMGGGDDYRVLCSVSPSDVESFCSSSSKKIGVDVHRIGVVTPNNREIEVLVDGDVWHPSVESYSHT